jgi:hypothetical protein
MRFNQASLTRRRPSASVSATCHRPSTHRESGRVSALCEHPQKLDFLFPFDLHFTVRVKDCEASVAHESECRLRVEVAKEHRLTEPLGHVRRFILGLDAEEEKPARCKPLPRLREETRVLLSREMVKQVEGDDGIE